MTRIHTRLDRELVRAVGHRVSAHLATAAHEVGHGLAEIAAGDIPEHVRLNFAFLGMGMTGGTCQWCDWSDTWTRERATGRAVALMAGHAAETRFRVLYLGMDPRKAHRVSRGDATGDYAQFKVLCRRFGLRISEGHAYDAAMHLLDRQGARLDRLTLRLERHHLIPGRQL